MKTITKVGLGVATAMAIFVAGCTAAKTKTYSEESLGLRKVDLYSEKTVKPDETKYSQKTPGTAGTYDRSFENAPPMIPHSVDGFLPITTNNNSCVGCHEPMVAKSMNATPIPKSHFTDYRPMTSLSTNGKIVKEGKEVDNVSEHLTSSKTLSQLAGARFNCSQCHAPQSNGELVKNEFQGEFRNEGANKASNLVDNINEGVK